MDNQNVKRGRGRPNGIHTPIKYFTEEERKQAITQSKTKYMVNKEWCCDVCAGHNYTLAGKTKHLKTKKHKDNVKKNFMKKIIEITHNNK